MCTFGAAYDFPLQLPLELIQLIILYMPFTKLRLLCEEDDSLKCLIAPVLYRYVSIGDCNYTKGIYRIAPKFHVITIRELKQLISGDIKARIQHLKVNEWWANRQYLKKVWEVIRDSSEFFSKIPIIDYEGFQFDMCMRFLPLINLRQMFLRISGASHNFHIDAFPPNITDLTIRVPVFINIPSFPTSLKHLTIDCGDHTFVFELPVCLELFCITRGKFNGKLPEGLLKLKTADVYTLTLPDSLTELEVDNTDWLLTLPSGLKKLRINSIDSLLGMRFPCNLEVLDCAYVSIPLLDGIVLPRLLRELRLEGHNLKSLDNVIFPNLILLDISFGLIDASNLLNMVAGSGIISLSQVTFPKLECLIAREQPIQDWSITNFPETLNELRMDVMENPRTLKFPLCLKVLEIRFKDPLAEYVGLQLPDTLEDLCLYHGVSSMFEWDLPQLRSMRIYSFSGPIKIPQSVINLSLEYLNYRACEEIALPPNVERLKIPYPLEAYPPSVTYLRIYHSDVESFPIPPNVESVEIANGHLDGSSFTLPNSLNFFSGSFEEDLKRPSNWDTNNEFCQERSLERG